MADRDELDVDQPGLSIVLSPVQLAAIMQGQTIDESEIRWNRIKGGMQLLFGGMEMAGAAALIVTPEPTMLTKVGGVVLAAHGSDTISTGLRQVWSGQPEETLTAQMTTTAASLAGASPGTARQIGQAVDIAVPLLVGSTAGAARAASIRAGRISLIAEEAAGGHTIARHIGKTEAELRARLAAQTRIPAASSFRAVAEAERAISQALRANSRTIETWARNAPINGRPFALPAFETGASVGYGVPRATGALQEMTKVIVVLRKISNSGKQYFVLTSYPAP